MKEGILKNRNTRGAETGHAASSGHFSAAPKGGKTSSHKVISLQRTIGNRAVQRLVQSGSLTAFGGIRRQEETEDKMQTKAAPVSRKEPEKDEETGSLKVSKKLTVGPAKDRFEDEADKVAKAVSSER